MKKPSLYEKFGKRSFDLFFSFILLIFLSPVLVVIAILISLTMGRPIFFVQKRPGKDEIIFNLYKFRTMSNKKDHTGQLLPDEKRLTRIGSFLRKTSLDELPELINIVKGEMSLVGPRPLLIEYLPLYTEEQNKRHRILPGLTGLAQINGRNQISWSQKCKYDIEYVKTMSFLLDINILLQTLRVVVSKKGINPDKSSSTRKFKGESNE